MTGSLSPKANTLSRRSPWEAIHTSPLHHLDTLENVPLTGKTRKRAFGQLRSPAASGLSTLRCIGSAEAPDHMWLSGAFMLISRQKLLHCLQFFLQSLNKHLASFKTHSAYTIPILMAVRVGQRNTFFKQWFLTWTHTEHFEQTLRGHVPLTPGQREKQARRQQPWRKGGIANAFPRARVPVASAEDPRAPLPHSRCRDFSE